VRGVFFSALGNRWVLTGLTVVTVLAAVAGCGPDLGKANFPRTTVSAEPGSGDQVPTGAIIDPAVSLDALRLVDPCQLVDKASLADLGAPGDTRPSSFDLGKCSNSIKDAGGKNIAISVELGNSSILSATAATGAVGGLPRIEDKQDASTCLITAVTSRAPVLGITVQANYPGGDPCRPADTILQNVVKRVHDNPPKYAIAKGTLLNVDPCTAVDDSVADDVVPSARKASTSLHACNWSGTGPNLAISFSIDSPPVEGSGFRKIDLGGGVSGFQKSKTTGSSECTINWQHRSIDAETGENVSVYYSYILTDGAKDDPCGKALKITQNVMTKLPKP
jgi:hypothetical protein